jgi:hypothetical protein
MTNDHAMDYDMTDCDMTDCEMGCDNTTTTRPTTDRRARR